MLAVILLGGAALAAALTGTDRLLAALAGRRVARQLAGVLGTGADPAVRIASAPFLPQLAAGVYREVEVTAAVFSAGGVEFHGLTARLSLVHAPVRPLLAGGSPVTGGIVAGHVTAIATIPFPAIAARLAPWFVLRRRGADVEVSSRVLLMPVSGTLAVTADGQRISVVPKVAGIAGPVGFVIAVPGLPTELTIDKLQVSDAGLEVTVTGDNVKLALAEPRGRAVRLP